MSLWMPSLSACCILVDASFAECDVSMDEKSTPMHASGLCTPTHIVHHLGETTHAKKRERARERKGEQGTERVRE